MQNLWPYRWLFLTLVKRDVSSRYAGSLGGLAWTLLQPLMLLGLYGLLFRTIFQVRLPGEVSFIEFVALALWPWMAFQESVQRGAKAISAHANLVRKVAFPQEILVIAAVVATFAVHMLGFAIVLLTLQLLGTNLALSGLPLAFGVILLLMALAVTAGLFLGAIQVFLPDLEHVLPPLFMIFFYGTPILYPISMVPEWLRKIIEWNPMLYMIEPVRTSLLEGMHSPALASWVLWLASLLMLLASLHFFRKVSPYFEDFV